MPLNTLRYIPPNRGGGEERLFCPDTSRFENRKLYIIHSYYEKYNVEFNVFYNGLKLFLIEL